MVPAVERLVAVTAPLTVIPEAPATIAAALTVPVVVRCCADTLPPVEIEADVIVPLDVNEAARSRPVTLAEFITSAPSTVDVFVASTPMMTALEDGPTRTTPLDKPVPASKIRSPPALPALPAA